MNKVTSSVDRLDQACEQFIHEFMLHPLGSTERSAVVDDLTLSLAMSRLALAITY